MNFNRIAMYGFAVVLAFLTGCASTPQSPMALTGLATQGGRIGVAMSSLPKVDTSFPGAGCLLCMAAASVANSSLTSYTQRLPSDELLGLKAELANALRKKGQDVVVIDEPLRLDALPDASKGPNRADKDFSALKAKYKLDKLLLIDVQAIGVERTYSAYVPTSEPKALFRGRGYLVNLSNNEYEWFLPVLLLKSADGGWDEPPQFPGVTNAYFQVLELGKESFLKPFIE